MTAHKNVANDIWYRNYRRLEYVLEEFLDIQGYPQGMRL